MLSAEGDQKAFAEHLIAIMENKTLRWELAENGRKLAQSRDWDTIFDGLLSVYRGLITDKQGPAKYSYYDAS